MAHSDSTIVRVGQRKGTLGVLSAWVEKARRVVSTTLDRSRRAEMGQFLTPAPVAQFMARMFEARKPVLHVLDPGAGVGSLSAAFVDAMCRRTEPSRAISLTACEIDPRLAAHLGTTLDLCRSACVEADIRFEARIIQEDFLAAGARSLAGDLFGAEIAERFDCVIMNPPYRKIRTQSPERRLLREVGVETSNLYTGFLAVAVRLLAAGGEMVAITPRSFCNGPYFEPFRHFFLDAMRLRHVHVFESRDRAFAEDDVLQENIIFRAEKGGDDRASVLVSSSLGPDDREVSVRMIPYDDLVRPRDRHAFIHIVPEHEGDAVRERMARLPATLPDLGLEVSTGRVVDFRARALLRADPGPATMPLIYPCHIANGYIDWPNGQKRKPNALAPGQQSEGLLVPAGHYVLVKRFSAKEERRRVVAAVYDPSRVPGDRVAFENHLNYYHQHGASLPPLLAKGLAAFLNSTLVDSCFRQFSGHTQVNAADLRSLRYPSREQLVAIGRRIGREFPSQEELDRLIEECLGDG